jgi:hypothetical protein
MSANIAAKHNEPTMDNPLPAHHPLPLMTPQNEAKFHVEGDGHGSKATALFAHYRLRKVIDWATAPPPRHHDENKFDICQRSGAFCVDVCRGCTGWAFQR